MARRLLKALDKYSLVVQYLVRCTYGYASGDLRGYVPFATASAIVTALTLLLLEPSGDEYDGVRTRYELRPNQNMRCYYEKLKCYKEI